MGYANARLAIDVSDFRRIHGRRPTSLEYGRWVLVFRFGQTEVIWPAVDGPYKASVMLAMAQFDERFPEAKGRTVELLCRG